MWSGAPRLVGLAAHIGVAEPWGCGTWARWGGLGLSFCLFFSLEPVEESLLEKYGFPEAGTETRCYTNHALSYDQAKRVPRWVIEHISKQKMLGTLVFISFHLQRLE